MTTEVRVENLGGYIPYNFRILRVLPDPPEPGLSGLQLFTGAYPGENPNDSTGKGHKIDRVHTLLERLKRRGGFEVQSDIQTYTKDDGTQSSEKVFWKRWSWEEPPSPSLLRAVYLNVNFPTKEDIDNKPISDQEAEHLPPYIREKLPQFLYIQIIDKTVDNQPRWDLFKADVDKEYKDPESLSPKIDAARFEIQTLISYKLLKSLVIKGSRSGLPANMIIFLAENLDEANFRNLLTYYPDRDQLTYQAIKWACAGIVRVWIEGPSKDVSTFKIDNLLKLIKNAGVPPKNLIGDIFLGYYGNEGN